MVLYVLSPGGVRTEYVYGEAPEVVRESTGVYYCRLQPAMAGIWRHRWAGTGMVGAAGEDSFVVRTSYFV